MTSHSFWILPGQWEWNRIVQFQEVIRWYMLTNIDNTSQICHDPKMLHWKYHESSAVQKIQDIEIEKRKTMAFRLRFIPLRLSTEVIFHIFLKGLRLRGWRWSNLSGDCPMITNDIPSFICVQWVGIQKGYHWLYLFFFFTNYFCKDKQHLCSRAQKPPKPFELLHIWFCLIQSNDNAYSK